MIPARRVRLGSWLTVVLRKGPTPGEDGAARRLFLSATWLLVALGILVPAWEATVLLHDRRVVARDFACLEARRAVESQPYETAWTSRPQVRAEEAERIALDVEGIGTVTFPPGLSDEETVAAMQALVVAHFRAGHPAHTPSPSAASAPPPPRPASTTPDLTGAEAECRIARAGTGGDPHRFSLSAWRREYAGAPPSPDAERAARRAFLRSALAILALPALFALRAWWRWVWA